MRRVDAGLGAVIAFFKGMEKTFRADTEQARRGCLMLNTLGELGPENPHLSLAENYRDSFREAFATALTHAASRGEVDRKRVHSRAKLLASVTMGFFLTARIDPKDAADVCDSVAAEAASWRLP